MYCTSYVYYSQSSSIIYLMLCNIPGRKKKKSQIVWLKFILFLCKKMTEVSTSFIVCSCKRTFYRDDGSQRPLPFQLAGEGEVGLNLCTNFTFLQPERYPEILKSVFLLSAALRREFCGLVLRLIFGSHKPPVKEPKEIFEQSEQLRMKQTLLHKRANCDFLSFNFLLFHLKTFSYGLSSISYDSRL